MDLFVRDASAADMSEAAVFKLYHYDPTVAGAVIFVFLFLATTILHFWQLIRSRCWFLIPLAVGGVCKSEQPCLDFKVPKLSGIVC